MLNFSLEMLNHKWIVQNVNQYFKKLLFLRQQNGLYKVFVSFLAGIGFHTVQTEGRTSSFYRYVWADVIGRLSAKHTQTHQDTLASFLFLILVPSDWWIGVFRQATPSRLFSRVFACACKRCVYAVGWPRLSDADEASFSLRRGRVGADGDGDEEEEDEGRGSFFWSDHRSAMQVIGGSSGSR